MEMRRDYWTFIFEGVRYVVVDEAYLSEFSESSSPECVAPVYVLRDFLGASSEHGLEEYEAFWACSIDEEYCWELFEADWNNPIDVVPIQ